METVDALGHLALLGTQPELVGDVDPAHHQHLPILLDLPHGLGRQVPLTGRYLARFQRTPEGSRQSASGRRDKVVKRRRVGLVHLGVDPIVLCHL